MNKRFSAVEEKFKLIDFKFETLEKRLMAFLQNYALKRGWDGP